MSACEIKLETGFPSPAHDFLAGRLNLDDYLIDNKAATFLMRVAGFAMTGVGIFPGDLLIVDRSIPYRDRQIIIAIFEDALTVRRLYLMDDRIELRAENPDHPAIAIFHPEDLVVWGVVRYAIHSFKEVL